jgi:hypothetical protein
MYNNESASRLIYPFLFESFQSRSMLEHYVSLHELKIGGVTYGKIK